MGFPNVITVDYLYISNNKNNQLKVYVSKIIRVSSMVVGKTRIYEHKQ